MIQALCLQKFRNKNNQIIGYRLQDRNGNTLDVKSEYLKQAIRNKQINILNLTLTSDNKLIDKAYKPQKQQKNKSKDIMSKDIMAKIRLLGEPIASPCGHTYYIIKKPDTTILVIPNDVKKLGLVRKLNLHDSKYNTLKVIGGSGLESTRQMFDSFNAKSIDLSNFDTSNVTDMCLMFGGCNTAHIDLSNFDTSKVTDMSHMFEACVTESLDLSSFDTSNVTNMREMFLACSAQYIDLSSFDTSNVTDMRQMFAGCITDKENTFYDSEDDSIDLSSFNTSKVTDMSSMFFRCQASFLDLSHFDTSNVTDMSEMFRECKTFFLDISNFDTSKVTNMERMFYGCELPQPEANDALVELYWRTVEG